MEGGGLADGGGLLLSLNLLIIIWYIVQVKMYICKENRCRRKVLWILKFGEVRDWGTLISNSPYIRRFLFLCPKLHFFRGWVLSRFFFTRFYKKVPGTGYF